MNEETRTCDYNGCTNSRIVQEIYEDGDESWDDAPDGWLLIDVDRAKARTVNLEFCSEPHMRAGLQQPLPPPDLTPWPVEPETWGDRLFVGGCLIGLLCILLIFAVGAITVVSRLF